MELLSKKILWKSPYFLNQQISISSDGRVVVNNSKEMNIFTLDNSQNIQEIGSIRIESIDSKGSNENILQIDSASNEGELFSIPNIMGGVFIASLSWISISINRDEILSILFSNGILLFFQTCKDNFTLEIPSVAGNELFLVHTINMKVVVNVTAELSKLLSTTDASYLNGGISAFEWTISNCGRSFPMHKHLILVSGNHICALDVSINENMFTFELKTHFKCSNLPDMGICRRLQYFRDIEVSPSLGYLFLVLDKSLSRMKVIYENDGCMHLEVDKEWQCERINSIVVLDQNTVLVSIDMDIFLLSDQSGPRFVRLQRIHTSNIISLFSQIPVEKNNQLSVAELNFVSSSLGGEIFSWRITPLDEQKSDWAITEFQIHASGLLKSVGLACDPQGTTLVSLQCIPPRLLDSKLTQGTLS